MKKSFVGFLFCFVVFMLLSICTACGGGGGATLHNQDDGPHNGGGGGSWGAGSSSGNNGGNGSNQSEELLFNLFPRINPPIESIDIFFYKNGVACEPLTGLNASATRDVIPEFKTGDEIYGSAVVHLQDGTTRNATLPLTEVTLNTHLSFITEFKYTLLLNSNELVVNQIFTTAQGIDTTPFASQFTNPPAGLAVVAWQDVDTGAQYPHGAKIYPHAGDTTLRAVWGSSSGSSGGTQYSFTITNINNAVLYTGTYNYGDDIDLRNNEIMSLYGLGIIDTDAVYFSDGTGNLYRDQVVSGLYGNITFQMLNLSATYSSLGNNKIQVTPSNGSGNYIYSITDTNSNYIIDSATGIISPAPNKNCSNNELINVQINDTGTSALTSLQVRSHINYTVTVNKVDGSQACTFAYNTSPYTINFGDLAADNNLKSKVTGTIRGFTDSNSHINDLSESLAGLADDVTITCLTLDADVKYADQQIRITGRNGSGSYSYSSNDTTRLTQTTEEGVFAPYYQGDNTPVTVTVTDNSTGASADISVTPYAGTKILTFGTVVGSSSLQVCDIVFNDGSATSYSESLDLTGKTDAAVAVIFRAGASASDPALGIGIKLGTNLKWCETSAGGYTNQFSTDENVPDGENTFTIMMASLAHAETDALYPAFRFAINYGTDSGHNIVSGTEYETRWYLPSKVELQAVHDNRGLIDNVFRKLGVSQLNENFLWSSSQKADIYNAACLLKSDGSWLPQLKKSPLNACAIRKFW